VRCAILEGVAPLAFTNPLYHAREAQTALELVFDECDGTPRATRPSRTAGRLASVLARLAAEPATVSVSHPDTGERVAVRLTRADFAEGLRVLLLPAEQPAGSVARPSRGGGRSRAVRQRGDRFQPRAAQPRRVRHAAVRHVRRGRGAHRSRFDRVATDGTFLGSDRVRQQMAVCAFWPKSELPDGFDEPVRADVPTLVSPARSIPSRRRAGARSGAVSTARAPRRRPGSARPRRSVHRLDPPGVPGRAGRRGARHGCVGAMRLPPFALGE
jgi:hypothetical protein